MNIFCTKIKYTYFHIFQEVTCLEFHPTEQILVSGSRDYTVKFFDYSKPSVKRAFRTIHVSFLHYFFFFFWLIEHKYLNKKAKSDGHNKTICKIIF